MKVKNIMFSGFAAAVLAGVCGAAEAADYTLASQGYVTKQLEGKQNVLIGHWERKVVDRVMVIGSTKEPNQAMESERKTNLRF